uniref:Uncharacterized protein n=1 Tax=Rhizophora mucronata TaxID=61149 RepID=A0A2P2MWE9_RHIMU
MLCPRQPARDSKKSLKSGNKRLQQIQDVNYINLSLHWNLIVHLKFSCHYISPS